MYPKLDKSQVPQAALHSMTWHGMPVHCDSWQQGSVLEGSSVSVNRGSLHPVVAIHDDVERASRRAEPN